jgi:hypothetical protein
VCQFGQEIKEQTNNRAKAVGKPAGCNEFIGFAGNLGRSFSAFFEAADAIV